MNTRISKYYDGYEGEPEIQFVKDSQDGSKTVLCVWDGYFDDIMRLFRPTSTGWKGLAYYYHLCIGWENESLWQIPDLNDALVEFQSLNADMLEFEQSSEVLFAICELLTNAIKSKEKVYMDKV